jgi:predicted ATPase
MIKSIRVKNFKSLKDSGELQIKPLTFLVGPNSSGKSSLIQAILLLKQTVDSNDEHIHLSLNDNNVQLGSYEDIIYKRDPRNHLEIHFTSESGYALDFFDTTNLKVSKNKKNNQKYMLEYSYSKEKSRIDLKHAVFQFEGTDELILNKGRSNSYRAILNYKGKKITYSGLLLDKFYNLLPFSPKSNNKKINSEKFKKLMNVIFGIRLNVTNEFSSIYYLGPLRDYPKRFYITSGQSPKDIGKAGDKAVDILWYSSKEPNISKESLEVKLKSWLEKFEIAKDVKLQKLASNFYSLMITDAFLNIKTNITNVGFGASQLLPIIVESYFASSESLIIMEQPEIHLHPKAQSILADLFIDTVTNKKKSMIIETHSEHLLNRIRRRVAEGLIKPQDVVIYYFKPSENECKITTLELNDLGQYIHYPDGFFDEDYKESIEHFNIITKSHE